MDSNSISVNNGVLQWNVNSTATYDTPMGISGYYSIQTDEKGRISPILAFKFIKKNFGMLERMTIERRLKKLEAAFNEAVDAGQNLLGEKILREISREMKETAMYAKGIKHYVSAETIHRVKNKIKGGHISDTVYESYTKVIPKDVIKRKKEVEKCFDSFIIYHYWNSELEEKVAKKQKMTDDERQKMRDPILFGKINEVPDRLYFIADWEDEHCDLTFDEIVDVIGKEEKITKYPQINIK